MATKKRKTRTASADKATPRKTSAKAKARRTTKDEEPETDSDSEEEEAPKRGRRPLGETTGDTVTVFIRKIFDRQRKAKLSDAEIADLLREEFPTWRDGDITERQVRYFRRFYNKGTLRGMEEGDAPEAPLHEYDAEGEEKPLRAGPKRKSEDDEDEDSDEEAPPKKASRKRKLKTKPKATRKRKPEPEEDEDDEEDED